MTKQSHTIKIRPLTFREVRAALSHRGYTPADRSVLWQMSRGRCFWCDCTLVMAGDPFRDDHLTVDHVMTRGSYAPLRHLKVAACHQCNQERGNTSAEDYWSLWARRLQFSNSRTFPRNSQ